MNKIDEICLEPTILILKAIAVNKDRAYLVLRSDLDLQVKIYDCLLDLILVAMLPAGARVASCRRRVVRRAVASAARVLRASVPFA